MLTCGKLSSRPAYNARPFDRSQVQPMTLSLAAQRASHPVARLGASHGYCFDGDLAHLNAEILCDESRLCGQNWALELWTDEGIKIAELPLGQLQANGSGCLTVAGSTVAHPPASVGPHIISLLLVAFSGDLTPSIEDGATYPQPASFLQPRLQGTVCSGFTDGTISFDIARIINPRPADNLSGTLALELWSLDAPYTGGAWCGIPVASVVLGTLAGQDEWTDRHFTVPAAPLPATGHLTLMLREWTPAGYLTRDYRTLARPGVTPASAEKAVKPSSASKTKAPAKAKQETAPKAKAEAAPKTKGDSINGASIDELAAIKGLSKKLAEAIVAGRPYATLDDVVRAKGMGAKLLDKLRNTLKL